MTSILTNPGALTALQTLRATNRDLEASHTRISTGKRINSPADGSAVWSVARTMEADRSSSTIVHTGLNIAKKVVTIAVEGAGIVTDQLARIHDRLLMATTPQGDPVKNLNEIRQIIGNIEDAIHSRQFNGVNLLSARGTGGSDPETYTVLAGLERSYGEVVTQVSVIEVPSVNLEEEVLVELKNIFTHAGDHSVTDAGTELAEGMVNRPGSGTKNTEHEFISYAREVLPLTGGFGPIRNIEFSYPPDNDNNRRIISGSVNQINQFPDALQGNKDITATENEALKPHYDALKTALPDWVADDLGPGASKLRFYAAYDRYLAAIADATDINFPDLLQYARDYRPLTSPEERTALFESRFGAAGGATEFTATVAGQLLPKVQELLDISIKATAMLGAKQNRIESQADTIGRRTDALNIGISALIDTNLEEESARLKALQTQRQLGMQALAVANQTPQAVLSLFR